MAVRRSEAPEAGSGILPMENHGKPLAELNGTRAFSLELAVSQSRNFGKLGPNTPGHFAPTTTNSLHHHRDESDTLALTLRFGVLMTAFEVLVLRTCSIGIRSRVRDDVQPEPTGDSEIPGGRGASPPPWDVHVSRAPGARVGVVLADRAAVFIQAARKRALGQQTRLLKLRMKIGSSSGKVHSVADKVVPSGAVTTSTTHQGVIAIGVNGAIAKRARVVALGKRDP